MVRPVVWRPPAEPSPAELAVIKAVRRARLFVFLRLHRHELFDEQFQAELAQAYADRPKGQPPVPPARLALVRCPPVSGQGSNRISPGKGRGNVGGTEKVQSGI